MTSPSLEPLQAFADALPFPIFTRDADHQWLFMNTAMRGLVEGIEAAPGSPDSFLLPDCVERIRAAEQRVLRGKDSLDEETLLNGTALLTLRYPVRLKSGRNLIACVVISAIPGSRTAPLDAQDAIERMEAAQRLIARIKGDQTEVLRKKLELAELANSAAYKAARTDPATGLRNRNGFDEDLREIAGWPEDTEHLICLAYLDLDRFKTINDRFGHKAGDAILRTLARRLIAWPDVLSPARMGGDEFAILFRHQRVAPHILAESVSRLRKRLFRPVRHGDKLIHVSGSIGLSVFGLDASSPERLMLHADTALLEAKRQGREQLVLFDAGLSIRTHRRNMLENDIRLALTRGEIVPVFQPIVDSATRRIAGAEVLSRWTHPVLGPIPAEEFVAVATDCGLISTLDLGLLRRASELARPWLASGALRFLSFNTSGLEIVRPGYAEQVLRILRRAGIRPETICIEIVESVIIHDIDRALVNIRTLKDAGVLIALDDYGTGYSNLRALLDLPVDRIKIDRSLIGAMGRDDRATRLIVSLGQLAGVVSAELIAEGVEHPSQADFLEEAGCRFLQGFLFGAPASADSFSSLLSAQPASAA